MFQFHHRSRGLGWGIDHSSFVMVIFVVVIVVTGSFIGSNNLLPRKVEAVTIPVNFVESLSKGAIKNRMFLGGHL